MDRIDTVEKRELPLYLYNADESRPLSLYFINGVNDLPFMDIRDVAGLMEGVLKAEESDGKASYSASSVGPVYMLQRENGELAAVDFYDHTVTYTDMDGFNRLPGTCGPLDIAVIGTNDPETPDLLKHESVFNRSGGIVEIRLEDYRIPHFMLDGAGYIPLQTVADLFLTPWQTVLLYNGNCVIAAAPSLLTDAETYEVTALGKLYQSGEKGMRSEALAVFSYNELCMVLDLMYGLKQEHGISDFDDYFVRTGLAFLLTSTDPDTAAAGLTELCLLHFNDGHSAYAMPGYLMTKTQDELASEAVFRSQILRVVNIMTYMGQRGRIYPESVPGYEEVGDTAYLTFDAFILDPSRDYYAIDPQNNAADVAELLMYANKQVRREDSPVKNIVIDLSCNGGGMADAAIMVISWYLGGCELAIENTATGARGKTSYQFDASADRIYGPDHDSVVNGYRLFCLISPNSFSCGNLVPSAFKASDRVTLLGHRSGGGACVVCPISTADGQILTISGNHRLNTVNNGIYYSVDQGVEPDIVITDMTHFYDRTYLTEYIDALP